ncbi:MAG: septal ring lytic transglycosylase RlpA family protein, partial [Desulfovibrio sp.]|nr:septal ring lytic transglycosylase RlpA family protein [Desulfovibrio sp.]
MTKRLLSLWHGLPGLSGLSGRPACAGGLWRCLALLLSACLALSICACGGKPKYRGGVPGSAPYTVKGKRYVPLKSAEGFVQEGVASWYGPKFHGRPTASGETYNQWGMTAAHTILPLHTKVRVTSLDSGRACIVRINDRGPFVGDRVIDLSKAAAQKVGILGKGTGRVRIQALTERRHEPAPEP